MKCPTCVTEGEASRVYEGGSSSTAMYFAPFYDEEGRRHSHDGNRVTTQYRCSRGHSWASSRRGSCWCGWPEASQETAASG